MVSPAWAGVFVAASLGYGGCLIALMRMIVRDEVAKLLAALDSRFVAQTDCHERRDANQAARSVVDREIERRLDRLERIANGHMAD